MHLDLVFDVCLFVHAFSDIQAKYRLIISADNLHDGGWHSITPMDSSDERRQTEPMFKAPFFFACTTTCNSRVPYENSCVAEEGSLSKRPHYLC